MRYQVLVKPGASQEKIIENEDGSLVIYLRAKPHDGEANAALVKLLSKHFHTAKSNVEIVRGQKGRQKVIDIL